MHHRARLRRGPRPAEDVQPHRRQRLRQTVQAGLQFVGVGRQVLGPGAPAHLLQQLRARRRRQRETAPVLGHQLVQLGERVVQPAGHHRHRLVADDLRVRAAHRDEALGGVPGVVEVHVRHRAHHDVGVAAGAHRVLLAAQELHRPVRADVDDDVRAPHLLQPGVERQVLRVGRGRLVMGLRIGRRAAAAPGLDADERVAELERRDDEVALRRRHRGARPVGRPRLVHLRAGPLVPQVGPGLRPRIDERGVRRAEPGRVHGAGQQPVQQLVGTGRAHPVAGAGQLGEHRRHRGGHVEEGAAQQPALAGRVVVADDRHARLGRVETPQPQQPGDPAGQAVDLLGDRGERVEGDAVALVDPWGAHRGHRDLVDAAVELRQHHRHHHLGRAQPRGEPEPVVDRDAGQQDRVHVRGAPLVEQLGPGAARAAAVTRAQPQAEHVHDDIGHDAGVGHEATQVVDRAGGVAHRQRQHPAVLAERLDDRPRRRRRVDRVPVAGMQHERHLPPPGPADGLGVTAHVGELASAGQVDRDDAVTRVLGRCHGDLRVPAVLVQEQRQEGHGVHRGHRVEAPQQR